MADKVKVEQPSQFNILIALADAVEARYGRWMSDVRWDHYVAGQNDILFQQAPREVQVLTLVAPAAITALGLLVEDLERRVVALEQQRALRPGEVPRQAAYRREAPARGEERWERTPFEEECAQPFESFPPLGLYCGVCGLPQRQSPGGAVCLKGHGGVQGYACTRCRDTHRMPRHDGDDEVGEWNCTGCPRPCPECRQKPQGPYCEQQPCGCSCHDRSRS